MTNIPGLETRNLFLLLQTFQLWICTSIAPNTSSLQVLLKTSVLVKEVRGQIEGIECCNSLICWVLWRYPLKSVL